MWIVALLDHDARELGRAHDLGQARVVLGTLGIVARDRDGRTVVDTQDDRRGRVGVAESLDAHPDGFAVELFLVAGEAHDALDKGSAVGVILARMRPVDSAETDSVADLLQGQQVGASALFLAGHSGAVKAVAVGAVDLAEQGDAVGLGEPFELAVGDVQPQEAVVQIGAVGERDELADAVDGDGRQSGGLGFGEGVIEGVCPKRFFAGGQQLEGAPVTIDQAGGAKGWDGGVVGRIWGGGLGL